MDHQGICNRPTMIGEATPLPIPDGIDTIPELRPGDLTPAICATMPVAQLREMYLIRSMQAGQGRREKALAAREGGWEGLISHWRETTRDQRSLLDYEGDRFLLSAELGRRRGVMIQKVSSE